MIVCIAEKPSVAREIARILGATRACNGYIEGNGYQVTWTFGHLCELKMPEDYNPLWKTWSLGQLPMIPERFGIRLKSNKGIAEQFATIKKLFLAADSIINCGDAGQEGELIQRWVIQKTGAKCPVQRLWISSMTDEAIRDGFAHLQPSENFQKLYEAGLCRAIGDWILGMNASRLYTLKYGRRERGATPLSVGRVQTPTLALIVRRQQEIENFVPQPYWVLSTVYRATTFTAVMGDPNEDEEPAAAAAKKKDVARRGFTGEEEARKALAQIEGKPLTITGVVRKEGKEAPPRLFDLTSLQVECNKKFSYSADQTLQVIQSLYEKKLTTYPRVDTTYLPDDVYPKCKGILNGIAGAYGEMLQPLRGAKLLKRKKVFDTSKVTDHHAIIPTGTAPNALTDVERPVYDLIARRFIAIFYPDCEFATTTVSADVDGIPFRVSGKQILKPAWREVIYPKGETTEADDEDKPEEERTLPAFEKGESGPHQPTLQQKFTQPPKPYTEATLLRAMETAGRSVEDESLRELLKENGIGRPSTRAAIIETLFRRNYIRKQRKALFPTPTGTELIALIREELLKSAELTGRWEKRLREIERNEYSPQQFIDEMKQMIGQIVQQVLCDNSNRRVAMELQPAPKAAPKRKSASPKKKS